MQDVRRSPIPGTARLVGALLGFAALSGVAMAQVGPPPPPPPPPPLGPPPPPPLGNPTTPDKVLLGKALFWDEQLSSTRTVACATCHIPAAGGSDPRGVSSNPAAIHPGPDGVFGGADDIVGSPGVIQNEADGSLELHALFGLGAQPTSRQTPSVLNAAYAPLLFWDGRATGIFNDPETGAVLLNGGAALESQAAGPVVSSVEMGHLGRTQGEVVQRVLASRPLALSPQLSNDLVPFVTGRTYPELFTLAFGDATVSAARIAMAIAAYERTQFTNQTPLDQLAANPAALTQLENQGRAIFNGPAASCSACHAGNLLTNNTFQYIGVRPQAEDLGRFNVTQNNADLGRFRVPGLRNVELRAPYFHDGSAQTLEEVVAFYNRGGDFNAPNRNPLIRPLGLTLQQQQALVAFLRRPLTDPRVVAEQPPFDHPALYATSNRVPQVVGAGTAGATGEVPRLVAVEPPLVGNPSFTIGLEHASVDERSVLVIDSSLANSPFTWMGATSHLSLRRSATYLRGERTQGEVPGQGWCSVTIPIPNDPGLIGQTRYMQWFVSDHALPSGGCSASEAVRFTFF